MVESRNVLSTTCALCLRVTFQYNVMENLLALGISDEVFVPVVPYNPSSVTPSTYMITSSGVLGGLQRSFEVWTLIISRVGRIDIAMYSLGCSLA